MPEMREGRDMIGQPIILRDTIGQEALPLAKPAQADAVPWQSKLPTHERISRLLIGASILIGLALGFFVTPWAYLILVGLAVNLVQFSFTGRCKVKDLLDRFGVEYEQPPPHLTRVGDGDSAYIGGARNGGDK
jgi:hypothetical protein